MLLSHNLCQLGMLLKQAEIKATITGMQHETAGVPDMEEKDDGARAMVSLVRPDGDADAAVGRGERVGNVCADGEREDAEGLAGYAELGVHERGGDGGAQDAGAGRKGRFSQAAVVVAVEVRQEELRAWGVVLRGHEAVDRE